MPKLEAKRRIEQASVWTARHPLVGPLGWGFVVVAVLFVPALVATTLSDVAYGTNNAAVGVIARVTGAAFGLTMLPFFVGTSIPGYIIGQAGVGQAGLLLCLGVIVSPLVVLFGVMVNLYGGGALGIFMVAPIILIPFAIGYRRGRRAELRAAERIVAAG